MRKRKKLRKGDVVRVQEGAWDLFDHRGEVCRIATRPTSYCTDYHKARYDTLCDVRFADGSTVEEVTVDELDLADAIDQLAFLARS